MTGDAIAHGLALLFIGVLLTWQRHDQRRRTR